MDHDNLLPPILLVDDDAEALFLVRRQIQKTGATEDMERARRSGADGYLMKYPSSKDLMAFVPDVRGARP